MKSTYKMPKVTGLVVKNAAECKIYEFFLRIYELVAVFAR